MPQPTVGRVVHYVSHGTPPKADGSQAFTSQCRAAIVAEVTNLGGPYANPEDLPSEPVTLCVLNPTGLFFNEAEHDEDGHAGGTWHWPERTPE